MEHHYQCPDWNTIQGNKSINSNICRRHPANVPRPLPLSSPHNGRRYSQHHWGIVHKTQAGDISRQNGTNANVRKKKGKYTKAILQWLHGE
jgi:hypothetical protein